MLWKRVIVAWMALLALVSASVGASARTDVDSKPHVGAIDVVAAICIEAHSLASAEEHQGTRRLAAVTSDVPDAARGGERRLAARAASAASQYQKQVTQALLEPAVAGTPTESDPPLEQGHRSGRGLQGYRRGCAEGTDYAMNDAETYRLYLVATNELLLDFAREAKAQADATRGSEVGNFKAGYLMGFHRVVSLMQQQAAAFGLELDELGLADIDPNRDLT